MKPNGIKLKTMMVAIVPILLMALLLEGYEIYMRFDDLQRSLMESSSSLTKQLAASGEYAVFSHNTELLKQYVDSAYAQSNVNRVIVYDAAGNVLMNSTVKNGISELLPAKLDSSSSHYENKKSLWLYEPIVPTEVRLDGLGDEASSTNSKAAALGGVLVEISKNHLNERKTQILVGSLAITLAVFLIALIVAFRVARKITRPIIELNDAILKIGKGAMDVRVQPQGVSELDQLALGVNTMARQLQQDRNTLQTRVDEATAELLQKKEMAENASQDKSRFLAAASHDLRQPLHALGLFVEELQSKVSTPEQTRIVELVEESISAMSKLLNSLLDISKLDAGVVVPRIASFQIQQLLSRMANDYIPIASNKGLTLRIRPCAAWVMSDSVLVERILLNLINNAIAYTPEGGRILVACRRRGESLRIEVRDSGIGIETESQQNVFREFFQLGNIERDRDKGLGLGLAIVERLSKLLKHPVSLYSRPGCGSVFAVEIPLTNNMVPEGQKMSEQLSSLRQIRSEVEPIRLEGTRILIVDDDALVLHGTSGLLESWGCSVLGVTSAAEAREQLASLEFDLLICDYRLADGIGLDVIRAAERIYRRHVPAILISGDTGPEVLQKVSMDGRHLLHKPVRPAKLRSLALFLLAGNR